LEEELPFKKIPPNYSIWQGMLNRCRNPNFPQFKDYGGRGIRVCERWKTYSAFAEDMGERPPGTTLDRIDNDGNYEPSNCRWATRKEQQRNQTVTSRVEIEGKSYVAVDLAEQIGVETTTIVARAKRGLSLAEVLDPTPHTQRSGLALGAAIHWQMKRSQTHCKRGHEFTPKNTYITKEGWRNCRECQNAKMRRRNAAKRAAAL
jgi:hypothetical protein